MPFLAPSNVCAAPLSSVLMWRETRVGLPCFQNPERAVLFVFCGHFDARWYVSSRCKEMSYPRLGALDESALHLVNASIGITSVFELTLVHLDRSRFVAPQKWPSSGLFCSWRRPLPCSRLCRPR
jgi:hypothetical protein